MKSEIQVYLWRKHESFASFLKFVGHGYKSEFYIENCMFNDVSTSWMFFSWDTF